MKKNQVKKSIAKKLSWQPGGPSRIAYDKRMQEKKTSSLVDQTGEFKRLLERQKAESPKTEMACRYYRAACLLMLADDPDFRKPAGRLIAEADAILGINK